MLTIIVSGDDPQAVAKLVRDLEHENFGLCVDDIRAAAPGEPPPAQPPPTTAYTQSRAYWAEVERLLEEAGEPGVMLTIRGRPYAHVAQYLRDTIARRRKWHVQTKRCGTHTLWVSAAPQAPSANPVVTADMADQ